MIEVPLSEACDINPAKPRLAGLADETPILFVPMAAVDEVSGMVADGQTRKLGDVRRKSYRSFQPEDVIFAKITPCMENGKSAVVPRIPSGVGFGSTEFHVLRPKPGVEPRYVWHFVRQDRFRREAREAMTGTVGQERVPPTFLAEAYIPLPSEEQQRQIADLLDSALGSCRSATSHLAAARLAIERFRQAVLAAVFSGRLTADWRAANPGSAHKLMNELLATAVSSRHPIAKPDLTMLNGTPESWCPVTLDLLIDHIEAGRSFSAHGRPATNEEWGVVKVSAMSWGRFLENENKAIHLDHSINQDHEIKSGDLLISRANTVDLVGATVLVDGTRSRLLLSDKSLRLVPREGINKRWLNYIMGAPMVREQLSSLATGTSDSMRNLSQPKILATTLALPSTDEQEELAHVADGLFALAGKLMQRVESGSSRVDRSSQALLAKAFRGQLALTTV